MLTSAFSMSQGGVKQASIIVSKIKMMRRGAILNLAIYDPTPYIYGWRRNMQYRILLICLCVVLGHGTVSELWSATIYSYIDDQGNPVFTDSPETIPEKYRTKVKLHEQPDSATETPSKLPSVQQKLQGEAKSLGWNIPSFQGEMKNLRLGEAPILNYAGIATIVLLLIMYFSKESPMIRLLALALLIVLGIGTPVLMYLGDDGPMGMMKKKAAASGQARQDRLQQVPQ